MLSDNGKEFTDRLFGKYRQEASGQHAFDALFDTQRIGLRLTRHRTRQSMALTERFNGRLAPVLNPHHVDSGEDLEKSLLRYAGLQDPQLPQ